MRARVPALLAASLLAAACGSSPDTPATPDAGTCSGQQLYAVGADRRVDLLFVVDESPAMAPYQEQLAANLPFFAQVLASFPGGLPDLHIAVVSADPAHAGVFRAPDGCGLHAGEHFISDVLDPTGTARVKNYDGTLADVLSCLGKPGASGSATAAPLASLRAALEPTNTASAGFHRDGVLLYVGILAAQDDCSGPSPPADPLACAAQGVRCASGAPGAPGAYEDCVAASGTDVEPIDGTVSFLESLGSREGSVLVGVAAAPASPFVITEGPALASSCTGAPADGALPAVRLAAVAKQFPGDSEVTLCGADWSPILAKLAESFAQTLALSCFAPQVDRTDVVPDQPGLQLDCTVVQRSLTTPSVPDETIARCPMLDDATPDPAGPRPCWWTREEEGCQPPGTGLALQVERAPDTWAPQGSVLATVCNTCDPAAP